MAHEESEWPVNKVVIEQKAAKEGVKKSNSELPDHFNHLYDERAMITINQEDPSWRLNPKHFSSWKRFTRVHAWVRRFVDNCRGRARQNGELKPSEIEDTEVQVIKSAQREFLMSIWPFNAERSYRRTVNYLLFDHDWMKKVR